MRLLKAADGQVLGLAFSPDGSALAAAVAGHGIFLWNLGSTGKPVRLDDEATDLARTLYFSPDGRAVHWLGSHGWKTYDRDTRTAQPRKLEAPGYLVWMAPTPDGRVIARHHFPTMMVIGWRPDPDDGWIRTWTARFANLGTNTHGQALCPTGQRFAVVGQAADEAEPGNRMWMKNPFHVSLYSAATGAVEASGSFPLTGSDRLWLSFSPDGTQLVAAQKMTLLVWPVPGLGDPRLVRNNSRQHFTSIAFHPSGRLLYAASNDATVHVFDTTTWDRVGRFAWRMGRLRAVAVSPDGLLAAAGGAEGDVVVWDVDV
jgi:WD40 repeat protein